MRGGHGGSAFGVGGLPLCSVDGRSWIEREQILSRIPGRAIIVCRYWYTSRVLGSVIFSLVYLQLARTPDCGDFNPKYLKSTQNARCGNYVVMKWDWRVAKCPL